MWYTRRLRAGAFLPSSRVCASEDTTLPDYLVTAPDFAAKGYGGLLTAGFFDSRWRVSESASWRAMDCLA